MSNSAKTGNRTSSNASEEDIDFLLVDDAGALLLPTNPSPSSKQGQQCLNGSNSASASGSCQQLPQNQNMFSAHQVIAASKNISGGNNGGIGISPCYVAPNSTATMSFLPQHTQPYWQQTVAKQQEVVTMPYQQIMHNQLVQQTLQPFLFSSAAPNVGQQNPFQILSSSGQVPLSVPNSVNPTINSTGFAQLQQRFLPGTSVPSIQFPNVPLLGNPMQFPSFNALQQAHQTIAAASVNNSSQTRKRAAEEPVSSRPERRQMLSLQDTRASTPKEMNRNATEEPVAENSVCAVSISGSSMAFSSDKKLHQQQNSSSATSTITPSENATIPLPETSNLLTVNNTISNMSSQKTADINNLPPEEKKRHERNLREQQRSFKITQQINDLRSVLTESNIPFKPNKFSILMSVVEYIKHLQTRSIYLDTEHRKLIDTIRQTSEMVSSGRTPTSVTSANGSGQEVGESEGGGSEAAIGNDSDMLFVQGIDYKNIFYQCGIALGVAALDGRFIDCNSAFETVSGYTKDELTHQSLFHLMGNRVNDEVFRVLVKMLKEKTTPDDLKLAQHWSGVVPQKHQSNDLMLNITLARTADGSPKFFNCALSATPEP